MSGMGLLYFLDIVKLGLESAYGTARTGLFFV